jgi:stage II sporulation protein D
VVLLAGQVGGSYTPSSVSRPIDSATLYPEAGTQLIFGRGEYQGRLDITPYPSGLAVVEQTTIDQYLYGIAEVPSSWPDETLAAQAVAARTYLAWTLVRGRSTNGTKYDYDICASQQCQVYRGPGEAADSWAAAVSRTSDEILVYNGGPAQALYSSSAGSRTRSNQDIWGGGAVPYLQAVDSPELGYTPYARWELSLTSHQFARVLAAGGYDVGEEIENVVLRSPGEGNGPEFVDVTSEVGVTSIPAADFRAILNVHGPNLYPGLMPATRADGRRWPQTILSYTFSVSYQAPLRVPVPVVPSAEIDLPGVMTVVGEGWGHAVGMSQWGAMALGSNGATYQSILELYYGLTPENGGDLIPETVRVGLLVEEPRVSVSADGPFRLEAPGYEPVRLAAGEYVFWWIGDSVVIVAKTAAGIDSPLFLRLPRQFW